MFKKRKSRVEMDIENIKESIEEVLLFIRGGPNPRAKKLRKTSYVFLTMPDPTSVSTMIGVTLFTASKVLEKRRVKGVQDYMGEYMVAVRELCESVRRLKELSLRL